MPDDKIFHTTLITPEGILAETDVSAVQFPAHDGLIGILTHRAPLLTKLGVGPLTLNTTTGEKVYFIAGGYAQMKSNVLTILPNEALAAADLTPALLEREKAKLNEVTGTVAADLDKRQFLTARVAAMQDLLAAEA